MAWRLASGSLPSPTLGERERAKEWAERALLLDPNNRNLRYNMACAMVTLREMDTAIELLESVVVTVEPAVVSLV